MENTIKLLSEVLTASMSPDQAVRVAGEHQLVEMTKNGETGVALAHILISQTHDLALRQIRANLQRKFILDHWSPFFPSFQGDAPNPEIKDAIRLALLSGLSDPQRKIRTASGFALSTVAQSDWPEECPDLLHSLLRLLSSHNADTIDGAMRVFAEFTKSELSEEQILPILRELLPVLMTILGSPDRNSSLTRARVLSVFSQCVDVLFMVKDQHKEAVKEAVETILPTWLSALAILCKIDPLLDIQGAENWDALFLRTEIFRVLERVTFSFPRAIAPTISAFLASAVSHLEQLYPSYVTYYASTNDGAVPKGTTDNPTNTKVLPGLGIAVMDFFKIAVRTKAAKTWLTSQGQPLVVRVLTCVFAWAQMTSDDEADWAADPNAFIAEEEVENTWTPRSSGVDLTSDLLEAIPVEVCNAIATIIPQIASNVANLESQGGGLWRQLEALLAITGHLSEDLRDAMDDPDNISLVQPIQILLKDVIPPIFAMTDLTFLQGRAFVFASQYTEVLPGALFEQYLNAAVGALESPTVSMPVKVSAVKAVQNFATHPGAKTSLAPLAPRILNDLIPFLPETSEDALSLIAETILSFVELESANWLDLQTTAGLSTALMSVWKGNYKDPLLLALLSDLFEAITKSTAPGVYQRMVAETLPTLAYAMTSASSEEGWIVSSAIELATSLMRGVPKGQLGDGFFGLLGPALFSCLITAEDRDILQNGVECLTTVIRKDCNQLLSYSSPQTGETGLSNVMKIVANLLGPTSLESESGGLFIGDMLTHLLMESGGSVELRSILPDLIVALVRRLQTAKTATFTQSLIVPLTLLVHTQQADVVGLLETTQIDGSSALEVFLRSWCENVETFQGQWASKMSTVSLCDLFLSDRASLDNIIVRGDMIIRPETSNVIMTRSRTKQVPTEYASVQFRVRALKILIHELQNTGENALAAASIQDAVDVDLEEEEEGDEWAEEEDLFQGLKEEELGFLSEFISNPQEADFKTDDDDLKDNPISQIDVRSHVIAFLQHCAQKDPEGFRRVVDELTIEETMIVNKVVGAKLDKYE